MCAVRVVVVMFIHHPVLPVHPHMHTLHPAYSVPVHVDSLPISLHVAPIAKPVAYRCLVSSSSSHLSMMLTLSVPPMPHVSNVLIYFEISSVLHDNFHLNLQRVDDLIQDVLLQPL